MRPSRHVAPVLALLVLTGGCAAVDTSAGSGPTQPALALSADRTLSGTVTVLALSESSSADGPCVPGSAQPDAVGDVVAGTEVAVYDASRHLLARAPLGEGRLVLGEPYEVTDWSAAPEAPVPPGFDATQEQLDAYIAASRARAEAMASLPTTTVYRGACSLPFSVPVSPRDHYVVEVEDRVQVDVTRAELDAADWSVDLTVP